jgi:hypothetical protein
VCSCVSMQEQGASYVFSRPGRSIVLHRALAANRRSGWSVVASGIWLAVKRGRIERGRRAALFFLAVRVLWRLVHGLTACRLVFRGRVVGTGYGVQQGNPRLTIDNWRFSIVDFERVVAMTDGSEALALLPWYPSC